MPHYECKRLIGIGRELLDPGLIGWIDYGYNTTKNAFLVGRIRHAEITGQLDGLSIGGKLSPRLGRYVWRLSFSHCY